jgi:hypothetical protein
VRVVMSPFHVVGYSFIEFRELIVRSIIGRHRPLCLLDILE